MNKADNVKLVN